MAQKKTKTDTPSEQPDSPDEATSTPADANPTPRDPVRTLFGLLGDDVKGVQDIRQARQEAATESLMSAVADHAVAAEYNVLVLSDKGSLVRSDADQIYSAIRGFKEQKDILLVLHSPGGEVEPAYLISQVCRESAAERFVVAVPRIAKSAATLICCGADEIHMGSMSELGPIDPQIGNHPALGLGDALRHIAGIVSEYPGAASMFSEYMAKTVRAIDLGYYERVVASAAQYAERLLATHSEKLASAPIEIAHTLVYEYKDHGFVIDRREAATIFGSGIIMSESPEYALANAMYEHLDMLRFLADLRDHNMYWVGSLERGCTFVKQRAS